MSRKRIAARLIAVAITLGVVLGAGAAAEAHHLFKTRTGKLIKAPAPENK